MTDKKTEELNEQELNQVTGGGADSHDAYANLEVSHMKSSLTGGKGIRATNKRTEQLNDADLDQVTGEAGGKGLLGHELTHVQQQGGTQYIGETEKNLRVNVGRKKSGKYSKHIVAQSGDGGI